MILTGFSLFFQGARLTLLWEKTPTTAVLLVRGDQRKIDAAAEFIEDFITEAKELDGLTDAIIKRMSKYWYIFQLSFQRFGYIIQLVTMTIEIVLILKVTMVTLSQMNFAQKFVRKNKKSNHSGCNLQQQISKQHQMNSVVKPILRSPKMLIYKRYVKNWVSMFE